MADIRPFHGVHYNQSFIKDLTRVLCPPYDVITPHMQQELYERSPYNFVRLEFGKELPQDNETDNKYTRAAITLEKWLDEEVLVDDESLAVYIHEHHFPYLQKQYCRRNITCLVKLEEWASSVVRPHEGTISRDKSDRLQILWMLRANTSSVMALYDDTHKEISSLLAAESHKKPRLKCTLDNGESHLLWAVTDVATVNRIRDVFSDKPLYVADGHHRYESALTYRRERRLLSSAPTPGEMPYDFVMMTLVDLEDSGLLVLPSHRLIRGISHSMASKLLNGLKTFFTVEEIPLDKADIRKQVDHLLSGGEGEVKLLMYGLAQENMLLLRLNDFERVRAITPYFHSDLYQRLNVSIVDHVILEKLLGITYERAHEYLGYCSDSLDAVNSVGNEFQVAVLLNPVKPDVIKAIADSGDRMPRKSTYFYPKTPTGLVFYRFG